MIRSVLTHPSAKARIGFVRATTNNMNNYPGLPMAFLGYRRFCKKQSERVWLMLTLPFRALWLLTVGIFPKVFVLEYGTDRPGYLRRLVELAPPNIGVITAVGPAHLAGLGTLDGVAREKSTVAAAVPAEGLVILGEGHEYVELIAAGCRAPVVRCSGRGTELSAEIARVIGHRFGVPDAAMEEAIASAEHPEHRLCRLELNEFTVIDDTYNANPLSMELALDTLSAIASPGARRRVAILGTMNDLGDAALDLHAEVGRMARRHADFIVGVGALAEHYLPDVWYPDSVSCAATIGEFARRDDVLLVKGSFSVGMERIVESLRLPRGTTPPARRGVPA